MLAFPAFGGRSGAVDPDEGLRRPIPRRRRSLYGHQHQSRQVVRRRPQPELGLDGIPGIPAGSRQRRVKIASNVNANALSVLRNYDEIFDWADTIPGSPRAQVSAKAKGHDKLVNLGGSTYYVFLNTTKNPFSNLLARQAVVTGLNQNGMSRLGSGTLAPGCYFLPPGIAGHRRGAARTAKPGIGNLAQGQGPGDPVGHGGNAGHGLERDARAASAVDDLLHAVPELDRVQGHAEGDRRRDVLHNHRRVEEAASQTGFADWNQDFPNPVDFYGVLLDGQAITPTNNENFGQTNDPHINAVVAKLGATPTTQIGKVAEQWQALDEYVAKKAYAGVFGYQKFPFLTSDRINYSKLVFQSIYGWDLSSFALK